MFARVDAQPFCTAIYEDDRPVIRAVGSCASCNIARWFVLIWSVWLVRQPNMAATADSACPSRLGTRTSSTSCLSMWRNVLSVSQHAGALCGQREKFLSDSAARTLASCDETSPCWSLMPTRSEKHAVKISTGACVCTSEKESIFTKKVACDRMFDDGCCISFGRAPR